MTRGEQEAIHGAICAYAGGIVRRNMPMLAAHGCTYDDAMQELALHAWDMTQRMCRREGAGYVSVAGRWSAYRVLQTLVRRDREPLPSRCTASYAGSTHDDEEMAVMRASASAIIRRVPESATGIRGVLALVMEGEDFKNAAIALGYCGGYGSHVVRYLRGMLEAE
jgi:hypothetical protein